MTRKLIAAALLALAGQSARADWGAPPSAPPGYGAPAAEGAGGRYGLNPFFKKMFWWKKESGCKTGNCGSVAPPPGAPGGPQVGTLVFPQHPFARSPRDFFMYEK